MLNLYNPLVLTDEQKIAYIKMLVYLAKSDNNPEFIEKKFIKETIERFKLPLTLLGNLSVPQSIDDIYAVLSPIRDRAIAIDLVHCLWFAATIDSVIADDEIKIIRNVARILNIDDDTVLIINNFVLDEITFLQQACDVLETEVVKC